MKKNILLIITVLSIPNLKAQQNFNKANHININIEESVEAELYRHLDFLFEKLEKEDNAYNEVIHKDNYQLTESTLDYIRTHELKIMNSNVDGISIRRELINIYSVDINKYFLTIATYSDSVKDEEKPVLLYILNLIASSNDLGLTFSIPLNYYTQGWNSEQIGNIHYHFVKEIKKSRAVEFNRKNTLIANKLNLKPHQLDFYMCPNKQEVLKLLGIGYSFIENGATRGGYGVEGNTIFSIMNNEDFSHDIFHYYSEQIHTPNDRNWIAEEGVAYLWGNAYYTDNYGEMVSHEELVELLKKYIKENPETSLWELFVEDKNIFSELASNISVRSTMSGIIAKKIESEKGIEGILKFINSGRKNRLNNYLESTKELIGISKSNFNKKMLEWIYNY